MSHSFSWKGICSKCGCSRAFVKAFDSPCSDTPSPENASTRRVRISVREYARLLKDFNLPTETQKEHFADFVAHSHSWYKHLPILSPGVKFHFFLHPYAAFARVILDDGRKVLRPREKMGFHYSSLPTAEYHERFGPLGYSNLSPALAWQTDTGEAVTLRLPQRILDSGTAWLTAAVHTLSGGCSYWHKRRDNPTWPAESGGLAAFERICKRSEALRNGRAEPEHAEFDEEYRRRCPEASSPNYIADQVLHKLLLPERERQYREIVNAISRVCRMIEHEMRAGTPTISLSTDWRSVSNN